MIPSFFKDLNHDWILAVVGIVLLVSLMFYLHTKKNKRK
jgi:LPXTG-motif cell wall-anchored protein